jgi:hypothetical protein
MVYFDHLLTWMGLQLIPYWRIGRMIEDLEKSFYRKYAIVHIELEDEETTDMVNQTLTSVREEADCSEEDGWQQLVSTGSFFRLSITRGKDEPLVLAMLRQLPFSLWIVAILSTTGRVVKIYAQTMDDDALAIYLVMIVSLQLNGFITHTIFVYLGGTLRMRFIQAQFYNMFGVAWGRAKFDQVKHFMAVQGCVLAYIAFNIAFFFGIRDSVDLPYNGPSFALWQLPADRLWLQVYGVVSTTISGIMFWESSGSMWYFMNSTAVMLETIYAPLSASENAFIDYKTLFYRTRFIMTHIAAFMNPLVNASLVMDMLVMMYGAHAFAFFLKHEEPLFAYTFVLVNTLLTTLHLTCTMLMCARFNSIVRCRFENVSVFKRLYLVASVSEKLDVQAMNDLLNQSGIRVLASNLDHRSCVAAVVWFAAFVVLVLMTS